jgi:EpsD family peptidyl-prolyl cis-trans isomerase
MKYAVLVLLIGSLGLTACEKQPSPGPEGEKVASWDGGYVSKAELDYAVEQLGPLDKTVQAAIRTKALDELVSEKLIYSAAEKKGLLKSPAFQLAEESATRLAVARAYAQNLAAELKKPTTAEIGDYYNNHPLLFSERKIYQLQQIHVTAKAEQIEAIKAQLRQSRNLQELAAWLKSQSLPVEVQVVIKAAEQLPDSLRAEFAGLTPGHVTLQPVADGANILLIRSIQDQPVSLEQATPLIEKLIVAEKQKEALDTQLKKMREATPVKYESGYAPQTTQ